MAIKYLSYLENPINLIEDCFKVQDGTQGKFVNFELFPKQQELIEKYRKGTHVLVNKSRQAGITTVTAAYIAASVALATPDNPYKVIIVANKGLQAQDFLQKIKDFLTQVPRWIWGKYYDDQKEVDGHIKGKGSVKAIKLFNGCLISAVATSKDAVRGQSSPRIIVIDEAAHIDKTDGETMYGSAMMALSSNQEGQMFLISTPRGTDPIFYKTYQETIESDGKNRFQIHQMYFFQDPRYNKNLKWKYKDEDKNVIEEIETEFDNEKMVEKFRKGWMPESDWYKEQCAILHHDKRLISQELLSKFDGSGNNVIDFEHIIRHEQKYVCNPIRKECNGDMWIFEDPIEGHQYCAFQDVGTSEGVDFSALQILNMTTGTQAAEWKGKAKPEKTAAIINEYCTRYKALSNVDTTGGYGDNVMSDLDRLDFKLLVKDENGETKGFKFSGITRPKVFERFVTYVEGDSIKIKSARTISELKTFIWINGRPDHMRGFNDDAITAMAGAIWLYETNFKNIQKATAINKSIISAWLGGNETQKNTKGGKSHQKNNNNIRIIQNGVDISEYAWLLR